jgi:hypothetical protein
VGLIAGVQSLGGPGGGAAAVAGLYMLAARIVTAIPRREKPT